MNSERFKGFQGKLVWKYFQKTIPHTEKTAECLLCRKVYGYRSTTGNLRLHLSKFHADRFGKVADKDKDEIASDQEEHAEASDIDAADSDHEDHNVSIKRVRKHIRHTALPRGIPIWSHFKKINNDADLKIAQCNVCGGAYNHTTTTANLKRHLEIHIKAGEVEVEGWVVDAGTAQEEKEDGEGGDEDEADAEAGAGDEDEAGAGAGYDDSDYSPPVKKEKFFHHKEDRETTGQSRRNSSLLWKFFNKLPNEDGGKTMRAECLICFNVYRYTTSTGNLGAHLRQRHPQHYLQLLAGRQQGSGDDSDGASDAGDRRDSFVVEVESASAVPADDSLWKVFKKRGGGVECSLCGDKMAAASNDMRAHLLAHHPKVAGLDEDSNSNISHVSLERNPLQDVEDELLIQRLRASPSPTKKKPKMIALNPRWSSKRQAATSGPVPNREQGVLGSFARYVEALLRSVPRSVASRLQADIVSLIMVAKVNLENQNTTQKTKTSESTPKYNIITIPNSTSKEVQGNVVNEFLITNSSKELSFTGITNIETAGTQGATLTTQDADMTTSGAKVTTSGANPTTTGARLPIQSAYLTTRGAKVTTSGANVTTSGANVNQVEKGQSMPLILVSPLPSRGLNNQKELNKFFKSRVGNAVDVSNNVTQAEGGEVGGVGQEVEIEADS